MRQNGPQRRGRGRPSGRRGNNNSPNRSYDSSGPDVKIRGTASTVHEKYTTLARDAMLSGDRVAAENFYQHAEHYYRVLQTTRQLRQNGDGDQQDNRGRSQYNRDGRKNENGGATEDDTAVVIEEAAVQEAAEITTPDAGAADEIEVIGIETAEPAEEESRAAPMNPAELAALSESGRKVHAEKGADGRDGDNSGDDEPAPRQQPRRRRIAPAPKVAVTEPELTDNTVAEDAE